MKMKTCMVCGKQYKYCMQCAQFKDLPLWYNLFDSEACHNVYHIIDKVKTGKMDAKKAKKQIDASGVKIANKNLLKPIVLNED